MDALAITKLDVLAGIDPLKVCVRYRHPEGAVFDEFPYHQSILHSAEPEYEELPGFEGDIGDCRSAGRPAARGARLPRAAISEFAGVPIRLVGVGPDRDQVVWMGGEPALKAACAPRIGQASRAPRGPAGSGPARPLALAAAQDPHRQDRPPSIAATARLTWTLSRPSRLQ